MSAMIGNVCVYTVTNWKYVIMGDTKTLLLCIINRKTDVRQPYDSIEHVTFNPV